MFLLYFLVSFYLDFVDMEFVNTDLIYGQYIEELSQKKYNKYDEFIADFEDDLAELDLGDDDTIHWEDMLFDTTFILVEFLFSVPVVAGIFIIGFLFDRKYEHIEYGKVFKITMLANFVFLLPTLITVFWFIFIQTDHTFEDLRDFDPLYLISVLDRGSLPQWALGPIYLINPYEVLFVFLVAYGLVHTYKLAFNSVLLHVSLIYLGGLFLWNVMWIYIKSTLG